MPGEKWNKPVQVSFEHDGSAVVASPFEALIYLTDRWPNMRGLQFLKARSKCRAALAGRATAEDARVEFIAAAREADLTAH